MDKVTLYLIDWLRSHNLPTDGVRLVVEFPDKGQAFDAENALRLDLEPQLLARTTLEFSNVKTMNGIGLTFRAADKRS